MLIGTHKIYGTFMCDITLMGGGGGGGVWTPPHEALSIPILDRAIIWTLSVFTSSPPFSDMIFSSKNKSIDGYIRA